MVHTFTQNILIQVTFEYTDTTHNGIPATNLDDAIQTAVGLAINPNFNTIEQGTHLLEVTATFNQETKKFK